MRKPRGTFWASLLVFFIPVVLSALVAPRFFGADSILSGGVFFGDKSSKDTSSQLSARARFSDSQEDSLIGEEKGPSFTKVSSDTLLDPSKDETFFVSFFTRIPHTPKDRYRLKLITKYESKASPYAGWAIALRRQSGALRPEVYWRGENSKGGWYSFGALELDPGLWHQFTLVVEQGKVLSLFLHSTGGPLQADTTKKLQSSVFLGGYNVEEVEIPKSAGNLELRAPLPGFNSATNLGGGTIALTDVVVASFRDSKGPLDNLLTADAQQIMKILGEDQIHLWIDSEGKDRSRLGRRLSFS
jgi:hypothetical protein